MDQIRKKMAQLKRALQEAEARATKAEDVLNATNEKADEAEAEITRVIAEIDSLEETLDGVESKLSTVAQKLAESEKGGDETLRLRKGLEQRSEADEARFLRLEAEYEKVCAKNEKLEAEFEDVNSHMDEFENTLDESEAKGEESESRVKELESEVTVVGNNLRSMEISEGKSSELEVKQEVILEEMQSKFSDVSERADENEARCQELENMLTEAEENLEKEKDEYNKANLLYDQTLAELADL